VEAPTKTSERESIWGLRLDLVSAKVLLLLGSSPSDEDLEPSVHLFFYDRYWRLAVLHEAAGRNERAAMLRAGAEYHFAFCRGGPPDQAATARAPRPSMRALAFGRRDRDYHDDVA
jgi:hypothetical protein